MLNCTWRSSHSLLNLHCFMPLKVLPSNDDRITRRWTYTVFSAIILRCLSSWSSFIVPSSAICISTQPKILNFPTFWRFRLGVVHAKLSPWYTDWKTLSSAQLFWKLLEFLSIFGYFFMAEKTCQVFLEHPLRITNVRCRTLYSVLFNEVVDSALFGNFTTIIIVLHLQDRSPRHACPYIIPQATNALPDPKQKKLCS